MKIIYTNLAPFGLKDYDQFDSAGLSRVFRRFYFTVKFDLIFHHTLFAKFETT